MKPYLSLLLLFAASSAVVAQPADFYVATNGSDQWSGTLAKPDEAKSDGPFVTLGRARDAVRDLKKTKAEDIVVLIRGGTYQLDKTIVFGLEDSPEGDARITYAAWPDETPVFSAGKEIKGWVKASEDIPGLPEQARGKVYVAGVTQTFRTLFDADGLLPRARSAGFIPLKGGSRNRLHFPRGQAEELVECKRRRNCRSPASRLDYEYPAIEVRR